MVFAICVFLGLMTFMCWCILKVNKTFEEQIRDEGIVAEGVVLSSDFFCTDTASYYENRVCYIDAAGETHEAILNFSEQLAKGEHVSLKYHPDHYEYALILKRLNQGK